MRSGLACINSLSPVLTSQNNTYDLHTSQELDSEKKALTCVFTHQDYASKWGVFA